jgi:hypothetical protein
MAMTRRDWAALAGAGGVAVLMPTILLAPGSAHRTAVPLSPAMPLEVKPAPPLATVFERPLFGAAPEGEAEALPADAPGLVGIVGRLGGDAVALVRTHDGATRTLRIGESVDGWQLANLAIDAAFFTRGAQRVRVPLPAG